ncbi:hypothetical protein [Paenibacillus qinlingensis]|uniref:hypothetical protein n=1 Tax=Paenibacillus qinlingensis TaxID=1837343 RepID=UPI00286DF96F|nr:hypothetical protein [Paenibacillus qinlingensis]
MNGDGGGKVSAAQVPIGGIEQVQKLHQNVINMQAGKFTYSFLMMNEHPRIHFFWMKGSNMFILLLIEIIRSK